jgi:hypothetical protein
LPRHPAGAGVTSTCNPADANYRTFYGALDPASWLELLPGATHQDFVAPLNNAVPMPPVCGKGNVTVSVRGGSVGRMKHYRDTRHHAATQGSAQLLLTPASPRARTLRAGPSPPPQDVQDVTAATTTAYFESYFRQAPTDEFDAWARGRGGTELTHTK